MSFADGQAELLARQISITLPTPPAWEVALLVEHCRSWAGTLAGLIAWRLAVGPEAPGGRALKHVLGQRSGKPERIGRTIFVRLDRARESASPRPRRARKSQPPQQAGLGRIAVKREGSGGNSNELGAGGDALLAPKAR